MKDETKTLVIDNFQGSLTVYQNGPINSGRSYIQTSAGQNPYVRPGQLTWSSAPVQIDAAGSVITDLIVCGKERVESGILYVYAVGHTGRVYKIQVNDPTTYEPNYDTPVLLTTLTTNSPTFTRGGFIEFYGATERMVIGHDVGVTRLDFDGTSETFIGSVGSWTQNVPRPLKQFLGKLYVGNGENIAEIDTTQTVTSYTKLSPGFPSGTQVRDLDVTVDGNYLEAVVNSLALYDITSTTQETTSISNSGSYLFKWNGVDTGPTAFTAFPNLSLSANILFQNYQYTFGVDQFGLSVYAPTEKILTLSELSDVQPNAVASMGNSLVFLTPTYYADVLEADCFWWGSIDFETGRPLGYWDTFFLNAASPETDILRVPFFLPVSNIAFGASSNSYTNNVFGSSKFYFSTLETSDTPTTAYRFYKMVPTNSPSSPASDVIVNAYYQTQTQLFTKKVGVAEIRIYTAPLVANNSFTIDLIGSDGNPITNGSKTFTVGTNVTAGEDRVEYSPGIAPTYAIGVAITNNGTANHVINKIEIDYAPAGN